MAFPPQSPQMVALLECLSCPVCYETLQPPIRQCINGHNICNICRSKTNQCPVCRGAHSPVRNLFAESAFDVLVDKVRCKFFEDGCTQEAMQKNCVSLHQKNCQYRPVICDMKSAFMVCKNTSISFGEYKGHVKKYHRLKGVSNCYGTAYVKIKPFKDFEELFQQYLSDPWTLNCDGKFFVAMRHFTQDYVYLWAVGIVSEKESMEFSVEICICNENKTKRKSWEGPVQSIRKQINFEENPMIADYFRIPLKTYLNIGDKKEGNCLYLKHYIKITKVEERAATKRQFLSVTL